MIRALFFVAALMLLACDPAGVGPVDGPDDAAPPASMTRPDPKPANVTVAMIQQKQVTCTHIGTNGLCDHWTWTANPGGFSDCAGDLSTYNGEITLHAYPNWTEQCVWAHPDELAHGPIYDSGMRDWDCVGNDMCPTYVNSRLHGGGAIYSGESFTGSFKSWLGPLNGGPIQTTFGTPFTIKSMVFNN